MICLTKRVRRCMLYVSFAVIMANILPIGLTLTWPSQQSVYSHIQDTVHDPDMTWADPYCGWRVFDLDMDPDDFRDSEKRGTVRIGLWGYPIQTVYTEYEDRYVREIQEYLTDVTYGRTDLMTIHTVLSFVRTQIGYQEDIAIYGTEERIAFPVETLYLGKGDCEDTSILFAAIITQMGYQQVLLNYSTHMAQAVVLDGTYYMCETASDRIPDVPCTDLTVDGETPRIEEIGSGSLIAASVFDAQSVYRDGLDRIKRAVGL